MADVLPPIQLPQPTARGTTVPVLQNIRASQPEKSWIATAWDYKHAAATVALGLTTLGPIAVQYLPRPAVPSAAVAEGIKTLGNISGPPTPASPPISMQVTDYEHQLRKAWTQEADVNRATSLRQMIYLYRRSEAAAMSQGKNDLAELYQDFRAEEGALDLVAKLPRLKAVVREEWKRQIPEVAPFPLTEPLRLRMADFARQTTAILERLL